jgi:ABC-type phosphate transport system substrate-binding protein
MPLLATLGEGLCSATAAKSLKALPAVAFAGLVAAATLVAAAAWLPAAAMEISGAGATFPYPIFSKWADAYQKETGIVVNYYQIGSGAGCDTFRTRSWPSAHPTCRSSSIS